MSKKIIIAIFFLFALGIPSAFAITGLCCGNECWQGANCCYPDDIVGQGYVGCPALVNGTTQYLCQGARMPPGDCLACVCTDNTHCSWVVDGAHCGACSNCQIGGLITLPINSSCQSTADCNSVPGHCLNIGNTFQNNCCKAIGAVDSNQATDCSYYSGPATNRTLHYQCARGNCVANSGWQCFNGAGDLNCKTCLDCNQNGKCDVTDELVGDSDGDVVIDTCDINKTNSCSAYSKGDRCGLTGCDSCANPDYEVTCKPDGDNDGVLDCHDNCPSSLHGCQVLPDGCADCSKASCQSDGKCTCGSCDKCTDIWSVWSFLCSPGECTGCGANCYFISGGTGDCKSCIGITAPTSCNDYKDETTCNSNPCSTLSCAWTTNCDACHPGCVPGSCGADRDKDGVADQIDNCPDIPNIDQANQDGDCNGDACEYCKLVKSLTMPQSATELSCQDKVDNDCDGTAFKYPLNANKENETNSQDCGDPDCSNLVICGGNMPEVCEKGHSWVSADGTLMCDDGILINCTEELTCEERMIAGRQYFCDGTQWVDYTTCLLDNVCFGNYFYVDSGNHACHVIEPPRGEANCSDGLITGGEQCDGTNWGPIHTCADFGFKPGVGALVCDPHCEFDTRACVPNDPLAIFCGNGHTEPGEECDAPEIGPPDISLTDCSTLDTFDAGKPLTCYDCKYNTTGCLQGGKTNCGDGIMDAGEQCDGNQMQCSLFDSFLSGPLTQCSGCQVDLSPCGPPLGAGRCGDSTINRGEQCDQNNWGGITGCKDFGFTGGPLVCDARCRFDTSACTGAGKYCGNGIIDIGEDCDGANFGLVTSCNYISANFESNKGTLSCGADCHFDTSKCVLVGGTDLCLDNKLDAGEQCNDFVGLGLQKCQSLDNFTNGTLSCKDCKYDTSQCTAAKVNITDNYPDICEGLVKGIQGDCDTNGETGCWAPDAIVNAYTKCCGDDGTNDNWLNKTGLAGCVNAKWCVGADCSEELCKRLVPFGQDDICETQNQFPCWSPVDHKCCGDITGETWQYSTNKTLDKLLVPATCYNGKWYIRDDAHSNVTYYGLITKMG